MDLLDLFKRQLASSPETASKSTLKNYLSDVRHFITWFEKTTKNNFEASKISFDIVRLYEISLGGEINNGNVIPNTQLSVSSMKRHLSSLRKFATVLEENTLIQSNPFREQIGETIDIPTDYWHLKSFKDYLLSSRASKLTIKNYLSDVSSFAKWYEEAILPGLDKPLASKQGFYMITQEILTDYRNRLLEVQNAAPRTVNRKLSSLRKYLDFAVKKGFVDAYELTIPSVGTTEAIEEVEKPSLQLEELVESHKPKTKYSRIPPFRLFQKLAIFPYLALEEKTSDIIAGIISGKPVTGAYRLPSKIVSQLASKNVLRAQNATIDTLLGVKNVGKEFYAPQKVSLLGSPLHKRITYHVRHTRPNWYHKYHSYQFVHYAHFALLIVFASGVGVALYSNLVSQNQKQASAAPTAPPRILSFQGRLTDNLDTPITTSTNLRFAIYNDPSASGGALLWQEVNGVAPDQDGIFSILLGQGTTIPSTVFTDNASVYLGVTVGTTPELTPRQRIATVGYATNAEYLQGLPPITALGNSDPKVNTVLALNSSGNLIISGDDNPSPIFQATGGQFTLSGNTLRLTTVSGTNSNVVLSPDGLGKIDAQKPIVNTTTTGNLSRGAVEINDKFAVLATESAVAAFLINNNTTGGDIFAASSSGTTRFVIANDGQIRDTFYSTGGGIIYSTSTGLFTSTTAGSTGECLKSAGGSAPTWGGCAGANYWNLNQSAIAPIIDNLDLLVGGQTTASAKFRFVNTLTGTPVASISANSANRSTFISGDGTLGTTERQTLTIGNSSTYNTTGNVLINSNGVGRIGVGTLLPLATIDIRSNITTGGTIAVASVSGSTSNAALIVDNSGSGDIFTASTGGVPKFTVKNSGALQFSNYRTNGGVLYTDSTGTLTQTTAGTSTQCLFGNLTWGACAAADWEVLNGVITPKLTSTLDLLLGSQATATAKFAFINVNSGTPTASISANSGNNRTFLTGDGTLATTNRQTLTLGNSSTYNSTGNILINPNGVGNVGVFTTTPRASFDVRGISGTQTAASISARTSFAAMIVDNSGSGDLFTASASGVPNFVIRNNGDIVVGLDGEGKITAGVIDPYLIQNQKTSGTQSLTFQTMGASNADFIFQNTSTELGRLTMAGQLRLPITGSNGGIVIGGDTQIFRGNADRLDVASGDSLNLVNGNLQTGGVTRIDSSGNGTFNTLNVTSCTGCISATNSPFRILNGAIVPMITTTDFLVGSESSNSAEFAVTGILAGTNPSASVSATTGGNSGNGITIFGDGSLQSLQKKTLTIGGGTSGNILIQGNGTTSIADATVALTGTNPTIGATGSNTVTINGNSTGNIQFFSSSNTLTSGGALTIAGNATINGTTVQIGNGSAGTIQTTGNQNLTLTAGSGTINLNTVSNGAVTTGTGLTTLGGNLTVAGATTTFSNAAPSITSGANTTLTISPNGTGNLNLGGDFDTQVLIGSTGMTTEFPLLINSAIGNNASLAVNNPNNGDLITASAAGTTRFTVKNDGTASSSAGFTIDGAGTVQSTRNQSLTIGGGTTGELTIGRASQATYLPGFVNCTLKTTTGGLLQCGTDNTGLTSIDTFWQVNAGVLSPGNQTLDFAFGGTSTSSAKFALSNSGTNPTAAIKGQTSNATLVIDNAGVGDLLAASTSGTSRFVIKNDGTASSSAGFTINAAGNLQTTRNQSLTIGGNSTGNIFIDSNTNFIRIADDIDLPGGDITGAGGAILDIGEQNAGDFTFNGDLIIPEDGILGLSGSTVRFVFDSTPATDEIDVMGGNLDLNTNLILQIGNAATNFTSGGGLALAGTLDANGQADIGDGGDTITLNGSSITFTGYNSCLLTTSGAGALACGSNLSLGSKWTQDNTAGTLIPNISTLDVLYGGMSTASAKFAVLNLAGSLTPVASVSATGATDRPGLSMSGNGTLSSINKGTLTIGGTNTGEIQLAPNGETQDFFRLTSDQTNLSLLTTDGANLTIGPAGNLVLDSTGGTVDINDATIDVATQATDVEIIDNNAAAFTISQGSSNFLTVSTVNSSETLTLGNTTANTAISLLSGGTGDITLDSADQIVFSDFTGGGSGCTLTTSASGNLTCGSLLSSVGSKWTQNNTLGTLTPNISTLDVLFGGTSTASAQFGVLGMSPGQTPTASVSATIVSGGTGTGVSVSGTGSIQSLRKATLTLGGTTTGEIVLAANGEAEDFFKFQSDGTNLSLLTTDGSNLTLASAGNLILDSTGGTVDINDATIDVATQATDIEIIDNNAAAFTISQGSTNFISVNTTNSSETLTLGNSTANTAISLLSGGTGDITLDAADQIIFSDFTGGGSGCTLTTNSSGNLTCGTSAALSSKWTQNNTLGTLTPNISTLDVLYGGTSTASAQFAILNLAGTLTPVASVSATSATDRPGLSMSGNGTLSSINKGTLTLGGATTGEIVLAPNGEAQDFVRVVSDQTNLSVLTTDGANLTIGPAGNLVLDSIGGTVDINDATIDVATQATDIEVIDNNAAALTISQGSTNFLSINTTNSSETLTLGNTTANTAISLLSGGTGDITIDSADQIVFSDFTGGGSGCTLTTSASGNLTCGAILSSIGSKWTQNNTLGTLTPNISTLDVLYGGTSTASAQFAVLNLAGSTAPVASVSATTASGGTGNGIAIGGDGTIQSVRKNNLTLGGTTTGDILLAPNGETQDFVRFVSDQTNLSLLTTDGANLTVGPAGNIILDSTGGTVDINDATIDVATQATDVEIIDNNAAAFTISQGSTNFISVNTTNSSEALTLGNTTANTAISVLSGGTGDITIDSADQIVFSDFTGGGSGCTLTTSGTGNLTCGSLLSTVGSKWTQNNTLGTLTPNISTLDVLYGGTTTASAQFAVLNLAGSTAPVASVSATTASGGTGTGVTVTGDGTIQSLRKGSLTLGGSTTGDIIFAPNAETQDFLRLISDQTNLSLLTTDGANLTIGPAGNLVLDSTGGTVDINDAVIDVATQATDIEIIDNNATALTISQGSSNFLAISTVNSSETVTLGNSNANTAVALASGGTGTITANSASTLLLDSAGVLELNSSAGVISIGNDNVNQNINLGTAGSRTIAIGNSTANTAITLTSGGTGDITANSADTLLLDSVGVLELNSSGGVISIGNDNVNQNINIGTQGNRGLTIGNANASTTVTITGGTAWGVTSGGALTVTSCTGCVTTTNSPFEVVLGAIVPRNQTLDFLAGGTASTSAAFKVTGQANPFRGTQVGASVSANTSFAALVTDNRGVGDLFVASSSGVTQFVVKNNGAVGIGNDTTPDAKLEIMGVTEQLRLTHTDNTIDTRLTVNGSGDLTFDASADGTGSETLTFTGFTTLTGTGFSTLNFGSAALTVGSCTGCGGGTAGPFFTSESQGTIYSGNATKDFLLGASTQATASAQFSVLGLAAGTNPTASVSAVSGANAGNGISLTGSATIQSLRNNTLTIGGDTTGNISLMPKNGSGSLYIGTNPARGAGIINIPYNIAIAARNSANNADITIATVLDDPTDSGQSVILGSSNIDIRIQEQIKLRNNKGLRGLNAAGSAYVDIIKLNTSNEISLGTGTGDPTRILGNFIANVDASITGKVSIGTANAPAIASNITPMLRLYSTLGTAPAASISAQNTTAPVLLLTTDGSNHDIFAASVGGQTKFRIDTTGKIFSNGAIENQYGDFAEFVKKADRNETFEAGQMACNGQGGVTKCTTGNQSIVGVVSDNAMIIGNGSKRGDDGYVLIGLLGQLGVQVTGDVKKGDPLTYSSTPGKAEKANKEGVIVGYALEGNEDGKPRITTVIQPNYYNPYTALQNDNVFNNLSLSFTNGIYNITDSIGNTIDRTTAFSRLIVADFNAGIARIRNLTVDTFASATSSLGNATASTLALTTDAMTIGGQNIREFIIDTVRNAGFGTGIVSPIAEVKTNVLSPLADNSSVQVNLNKDSIEVKNSQSYTTVARIDNTGNATFSGELIARNIESETTTSTSLQTSEATVAGTLRANNIIASNIEGLDQKLATLAAQISNTGTPNSGNQTATSSSQTSDSQFIATNTIQANFGIFEHGIVSMGPVTSNIITATDQLAVGSNFSISNNAINTIGSDLEIQSFRQGNIAFQGGLITMDTDGNMAINGNLNVNGEIDAVFGVFSGTLTTKALATSLISPLPGEDLTIRLTNDIASKSGKLKVETAEGKEVLAVNNKGDIFASGTATLAKLNFNLVGEAEASSLNEAVASGSAGFATLRAGQPEVTIKTPFVTKDSLIYITPFGNTNNKVLYLLRQVPQTETEDGSFTVGISGPTTQQNLQFNWLIVN